MTHDELLDCITKAQNYTDKQEPNVRMTWELNALRAVVELHKPTKNWYDGNDEITDCKECSELISDSILYPCPTIQAIAEVLR